MKPTPIFKPLIPKILFPRDKHILRHDTVMVGHDSIDNLQSVRIRQFTPQAIKSIYFNIDIEWIKFIDLFDFFIEWSEWSEFQPCDRTCGPGKQVRTRKCIGGSKCRGKSTNAQACNLKPCPIPIDDSGTTLKDD